MPVKSDRMKKPAVNPQIHKPETEEDEEEVVDLRSRVSKKPMDFDLGDSVISDDEGKEDILMPTDDSDEFSSEDALDEEEVNPFGDKWEM